MGLGGISGRYNRLDKMGKLIPWTIRSPAEIVQICLDAMGEVNALVEVPDGIPRKAGRNVDRYLKLGENFPQSLTNPPVEFDHSPPAEVLARFVEQFGCRVIYDPIQNRVKILPLGVGGTLPSVPAEAISPSFENPRIPNIIGVAGAPVRLQMRFVLEPVAEEWDGSLVPVNTVSYTPDAPTVVQDFDGDAYRVWATSRL